jgi:hypothetical protein
MTSITDNLTAAFPHPILNPLCDSLSGPTCSTIYAAKLQLNANAASVHSNSGNGIHGHLALTITAAAYTAISVGQTAFTVPLNLGPSPTHTVGATGPQITETNREYSETQRLFKLYHDVDKALQNQLIKATPLVYLEAIADPTIGFGITTTLQLLTHLKNRYGTIDDKALWTITSTACKILGIHLPLSNSFSNRSKSARSLPMTAATPSPTTKSST